MAQILKLALWSTYLSNANLQPLTSHMAARNSSCMRNAQSGESWGSECGNSESGSLVSAAIGGPHAEEGGGSYGSMWERWMWLLVCLCVRVCVWALKHRQDGWSVNSVLCSRLSVVLKLSVCEHFLCLQDASVCHSDMNNFRFHG